MVFGVVSSGGHIMLHHIFEVSLKVKTQVYLDVLKCVGIPWCNQVIGGSHWLWQKNSAPAHKSKETQAWLQKKCYDFVAFSHCPLLPRPELAGLLPLVIRREHHQREPDRRHPPRFRRRLWKRHAPSSWSVSRRWLRLKVATSNWYKLYCIIITCIDFF